jgi:translocation and assembly module TamB
LTKTPKPKKTAPDAKIPAGRNLPKIGGVILAVVAAIALIAVAIGRYGAITPQGRMFVEARASGLKLGRIGKLHIEGVGGDIWSDFTVRRLTISDEKGVWLQAQNLSVRWRSIELFSRRFHAEAIKAEQVQVLRRPTLTPKTKSGAAPVSVDLDSFAARLMLEPAFSGRRGDYDVAGSYEMARLGGQLGRVRVDSRLHAGDFLSADFDLGRTDTLRLNAQAVEAAGGALAGSLGFDPRQAFSLNAKLSGAISRGRFELDTRLGATQPLKASGAWTPEGGSAAGVAVLSASTLTAPYGLRFGDAPKFEISGAKAAGGFYDLRARIDADNLSLSARGLGDIGARKLGPAGLTLDAAVPVMSRILATPALGRTTASAVLTGDLSNWALDGSASAERFALAGYTLARVSGPVRLASRDGELSIKADLAGQGGGGGASYAALLGARPKATADIARLKDGRWLFRRVNAVGSGLTVVGEGARGLLGGLSFKGDVTLTNLAAIRPDAKGRLTARLDASQARGGQPWRIALDGRGVDFASGLAEADRLLGARPTLALRGALAAGGVVSLASAKLDGASVGATGAGQISSDRLALNIDWSAQGPFSAGALEIAGAAKGNGVLTGSLAEPALKLAADFEAIDLPRLPLRQAHLDLTFRRGANGSDGDARLTAASDYGPARMGAAFRFAQGGLDLTDIDADAGGVQAKGALSLRRARPSTADLTVAVGPGALLANGRMAGTVRIADSPGGARARLDLTAENALLHGANLSIAAAKITADGPLANLPLSIQARGEAQPGRWRVDVNGRLTDDANGQALSLDGLGELGRARVSTRETAVLRLTPGGRSARLRLAVGPGTADIDLHTDTAGATLNAVLTGVDISALNEDLDGQIDARLNLQGRGPSLAGDLNATVRGVREHGAPTAQSLDGQLAAQLAGDQLRLSGAARTVQGLTASAEFTLPAQASASPLRLAIDRTRPMAGRFSASGEVRPLWNLLIGNERSLSGRADISLALSGTVSEPRAEGRASLAGGRFEDGATGLTLTDVALSAELSQSGVDLRTASAGDGAGGTISGSGRFDLRKGAASSLTLDMTDFRLIDNQLGDASASGRTTLSRDADGRLKLAGALTLDRADLTAAAPTPSGVVALDVIERNRPPDLIGANRRAAPAGRAMILDVTLKAPRRIFVRGRGLDVELSLDAHLTGTTAQPLLGGTARVVRGDYDFAGKRFEFDDRGVVFLAAKPELIRLDLTAVREDPTLTATVIIKGTAARPEITLSSSPSLPSDEVLSQVLFGASAAQLSPLEAAQLASALAALSGGGGFDVIGNLRSLTRLDRIAFAGDAAGGMTVAGGKYLTDDVYLEIIGGGREGPAAQVEWRVRRNLSVVSRLSAQNDGRLSVRWRRDF